MVPAWLALLAGVAGFLEEAAFRIELAFDVLLGRVPRRAARRYWNRSTETPVLLDVSSWIDERLVFSVLVWPVLDAAPGEADRAYRERVDEVIEAIARGVSDKAWATRIEADYGLRWDNGRGVWAASDGFAYDGERLRSYSRARDGG